MTDKSPAAIPSKEDVVGEFRRRSIIEAAGRVFGERGFEQATVEAIAEAAAVAKGTVYLYYSSKQAIYEATFAAGMAELERLMLERVEQAATAREAIQAFVVVRAQYFQQHPDFFRIYVAEFARQVAAAGTLRGVSQQALDRQTRALKKVIARAVASGEIRPVDPEAAALAVFDMSKGLVARHLLIGSKSSAQRDIEFLTDLIWTGLKPARGQKK
jgi:AcrR family transcriptional regulator